MTAAASDPKAVEPFTTPVDPVALADLRQRLLATRWAAAEVVDDWSQGVPLEVLQRLCAYWADGYDWPARAARLDRFPQFRTTIDGLGIHFVHVQSPHPRRAAARADPRLARIDRRVPRGHRPAHRTRCSWRRRG